MLLAMAQGGMPSPVFDNDYVAELLYPMAMKKVIIAAGYDPYKQKDVRVSQPVFFNNGIGAMPANVALECLDTATMMWPSEVRQFFGDAVHLTTNQITIPNHGYQTGQAVKFSDTCPKPLIPGQIYYIENIEIDRFSVCSSRKNALNSVEIDLTDVSPGPTTIYPLGKADFISFMPYPENIFRPAFSEFAYWSADTRNLYFTPMGDAFANVFTGELVLTSVVFPEVNPGNSQIDIILSTPLAEDIVDDIVRELASAIRQEVAVKALAA